MYIIIYKIHVYIIYIIHVMCLTTFLSLIINSSTSAFKHLTYSHHNPSLHYYKFLSYHNPIVYHTIPIMYVRTIIKFCVIMNFYIFIKSFLFTTFLCQIKLHNKTHYLPTYKPLFHLITQHIIHFSTLQFHKS